MSANVPLSIRIAAIFDNKGLKQADKGIKGLTSSVRKLAGAAGIGLSTAAVVNFGNRAMKAFAENEKSAARLATVIKNLGLAFETPAIEASLDRMSAKFGFEGEVLREAFQKLITSTGSALKAQELLNTSLDIAAGSGVDLLTVNQDLAAAYVGQTRGLRKYNLGLTQAQLKTLKFEDALDLLTGSFKGAAGAELETYSGQMRVLQEASDNAQEIIGGGLIDSLMILSGDTSVEDLAESMTELAESTSTALTQLSSFGKGVKDIFGGVATVVEKFILTTDPFVDLIVEGDPSGFMDRPRARAGRFFQGGQDSILEAQRNRARAKAEADRLKAEAARLKLEKQRALLEKQRLAREKQQNALLKASQTLDLERIGIAAALKGQISETDQISLRLQLALLNENDEAATRLSALLTDAVKRQNELNAMLLATPEAPNPFRNWKVPTYDFGGNLLGTPVPNFVPPAYAIPAPALTMPETVPNPYTGGALPGFERRELPGGRGFIDVPLPRINVTVELDGKVVSDAIRDSTLNESLSGSFSEVNRTNRFAPQGVIAE
jgi:hypothetical protein